jgi:hypothetical protein
MSIRRFIVVAIVVGLVSSGRSGRGDDDDDVNVDFEVKTLPGLKHAINFKHYSGFLNVSTTHRLHYW